MLQESVRRVEENILFPMREVLRLREVVYPSLLEKLWPNMEFQPRSIRLIAMVDSIADHHFSVLPFVLVKL